MQRVFELKQSYLTSLSPVTLNQQYNYELQLLVECTGVKTSIFPLKLHSLGALLNKNKLIKGQYVNCICLYQ